MLHFVRCDVAQPREVERALALAADPPAAPLRGVWHAAGVLADGLLAQQGASGLRRVSASKSHGAALLHRDGSALPLQASVLFSSIAALFGGAGQANYSAASSGLDALAQGVHARGRAALSVQWGPWASSGMAAADNVRTRLQAAGIGLLAIAAGGPARAGSGARGQTRGRRRGSGSAPHTTRRDARSRTPHAHRPGPARRRRRS